MSAPTWDGWPEVIAAQNADVESHAACLLSVAWDHMSRPDWVPIMWDTGIQWDSCAPEINLEATFEIKSLVTSKNRDLWTPIDQEKTDWTQVTYPR
jgi:hypothetical protein